MKANSRDQTWSRCGALVVLLVDLIAAAPSVGDEANTTSFNGRLADLAARCDEIGLKEQAELTRGWIIPRYPGRQYLFVPAATDSSVPKAGAPDTIKQWHKKFVELRREQAAALFAEAKSASDRRQAARAYQLLHETLREDPDHADARRILGYVKAGSQWRLPDEEKAVPRQPPVNHPKLGWPARGYWNLETPHFQIVTNSKADLTEAGQQLENLHTLWRQIFFSYWSSPEALAARFAGMNEPLARPRPKMQVVLFKTQQEYAAQVAAAHPKAAATLGLYDDKQRIAYFFAGNASVYPTWYHEATHQLFRESLPDAREEPGQARNFWALEGAALYMESLARQGGYWTAGGCEADRLQFARYRVLSGELKLSLAQLTAMPRDELQNSRDIGQIYTQSAGLSHFLIDGQDGKYREPFIELLTAIYRGEDAAETLAKATGQPLRQLDDEYRTFLNVTDNDLAGIPNPLALKNLSLCRSSVTDEGLARFSGSKNLAWLDLSFTAASDAGLKSFAANSGLKQLFLEGTKVTGASLPLIAGFKQLEELDLSGLSIKDDDVAAIASLRLLKTLFLTGCPISDAGLVHLRGLKQLEVLEHSGTQITDEGFNRLRSTIPKLR
jgi:hypothetical protein